MRGSTRVAGLALVVSFGLAPAALSADFDKEPILYATSTADNAVSRLQKKLDAGQAKLRHDEQTGYLKALLRELRVPVSSQMLVFSKRRWGGWYVTGTHGKQEHLGNLVVRTRDVPRPVDNPAGQNLTDLGDRFARSAYLSPHSDIVALMVLEHQADAHNLLTRASFEARQALHLEAAINREMKLPPSYRWNSTDVRIRSAADALVRYLFFCDEAPLAGRIKGTSGFAAEFAKRGPRDSKGRSLRDLDLERRLFRYPLSYLVYSESFDALPGRARDYVLERMWRVLTGKETGKEFAHLSAEDRRAIREILVATKANLPAYWRAGR